MVPSWGTTLVASLRQAAADAYYLEAQEDYYLGGQEPQGLWWNEACHFKFHDRSPICNEAFRALYEGFSPDRSRALAQNASGRNRRPGYDICLSADKTVSALWAVAPDWVRVQIEGAQEDAVRAALSLLQRHAAWTRRGKGGTAGRERVSLLGATFQHGDSRAGDPQLHTHAVIFNVARRYDGTWGSITAEAIYKWKMAAGAAYRAELAWQLTRRLGLTVERHGARNEFFRVSGVPEAACAGWSKRRAALIAKAEADGYATGTDPRRAAAAVLKLRQPKVQDPDRRARWAWEGSNAQWGGGQVAALVNLLDPVPLKPHERTAACLGRAVQAINLLTEKEAVLSLPVVHRAIAEAAPGLYSAGEAADLVERLEGVGVLLRLDIPARDGEVLYTTQAVMDDEIAVRALARAAYEEGPAAWDWITPNAAAVAFSAAKVSLNEAQRAGAEAIMGGSPVTVVEGAPGSGKTEMLRVPAAAVRGSGGRVVAAAVAWEQAGALGSGIAADEHMAVDALVHRWRKGLVTFGRSDLVVVDEAGLLSAAQARALLEVRRATGCRLAFVGDRKQLQPVGAGPGLSLVAQEVGSVRVDVINRQEDPDARRMVLAMLDGRAAEGLKALRERNRVLEARGAEGAVRKAVAAWRAAELDAPGSCVVMAATHTEVLALCAAMRHELRVMRPGALGPDLAELDAAVGRGGRTVRLPIAVGDRIRLGRRDKALGVNNGTLATVVGVRAWPCGRTALVLDLEGAGGARRVELDTGTFRDAHGHVPIAHAYAMTLHSAQGVTRQRAVLLAGTRLSREAIAVGVSRAREWPVVVVDRASVEAGVRLDRQTQGAPGGPITQEDVDKYLAVRWSCAARKRSALDFTEPSRATRLVLTETSKVQVQWVGLDANAARLRAAAGRLSACAEDLAARKAKAAAASPDPAMAVRRQTAVSEAVRPAVDWQSVADILSAAMTTLRRQDQSLTTRALAAQQVARVLRWLEATAHAFEKLTCELEKVRKLEKAAESLVQTWRGRFKSALDKAYTDPSAALEAACALERLHGGRRAAAMLRAEPDLAGNTVGLFGKGANIVRDLVAPSLMATVEAFNEWQNCNEKVKRLEAQAEHVDMADAKMATDWLNWIKAASPVRTAGVGSTDPWRYEELAAELAEEAKPRYGESNVDEDEGLNDNNEMNI